MPTFGRLWVRAGGTWVETPAVPRVRVGVGGGARWAGAVEWARAGRTLDGQTAYRRVLEFADPTDPPRVVPAGLVVLNLTLARPSRSQLRATWDNASPAYAVRVLFECADDPTYSRGPFEYGTGSTLATAGVAPAAAGFAFTALAWYAPDGDVQASNTV